jgi:hypothetical protein
MEATGSSDTLVPIYQNTQHHITEELNPGIQRRDNLKSDTTIEIVRLSLTEWTWLVPQSRAAPSIKLPIDWEIWEVGSIRPRVQIRLKRSEKWLLPCGNVPAQRPPSVLQENKKSLQLP